MMSSFVKFKSINIHPDYHKKLKRLSTSSYRSLVGQLEYMIEIYNQKFLTFLVEMFLRINKSSMPQVNTDSSGME